MKKEKRCACSACNRFHHSFPGSPVIVGVSVKVFVGFWTLEDFLDFFIKKIKAYLGNEYIKVY